MQAIAPSAAPVDVHTNPADIRTTGELINRQIPGGASHFVPRVARIYIPPAAVRDPHLRLPVLELLHGTPGSSLSWLDPTRGNLLPLLESFANKHHGRTPIVVMPDINGSTYVDTECVRSPNGGNVEQYLTDIVPAWIVAHLPATTNHRDWAVAGLSEGGTCSLMMALRHRSTFATVGDFSGLAHLTLGDGDQRARTVKGLFGGSESAYDHFDPPWLIEHARTLRGLAIWLEVGTADRYTPTDQKFIARIARAKHANVQAVYLPGLGHVWPVWRNALSRMLPWWWQRISA